MKILFFAFVICLFFCPLFTAAAQNGEINIIPKPKSITRLKGDFIFNRKTKIVAKTEAARRLADLLNDYLLKTYNFKLEKVSREPKTGAIVFDDLKPAGTPPDAAANGILVSPKGVRLYGIDVAGNFYALQSFLQLLPTNFNGEAKIPALDLVDEPRFRYRGMHLDVGRHFFPVEFVKKYIDLMAQYKFNYFHWHLTEDQGWRIEIKKYPRLTEIGSRRKETMKEKNFNPYVGDGIPVEGFYTQEQIKDVVAYAKQRYITVIPEIELPGHSSAALAAYPELGCKTDYQYKVQTTWGIFKEVYCPTEKTFQFLEDVLSETIALFPDSPYIHIGGDEVLKDHWKESAFVQELKQKENLKDEHEVQSYFIRRIEKFINSKGKKIIGWDEILEGGLAPNATVMSWRGMKGGIEAAKAKHDVIMTPTDFAYLDYGQGDPKLEPINIGSYTTLQKVYSFEPVPKELTEDERKYILGGQGNVWTEYMKTAEKVEYMVFPRMLALAEVLWSAPENKNFDDFRKRLSTHFARLDRQNVNYRIPEPIGLQNILITGDKDTAEINMDSILANGKVYYTIDGSEPSEKSAPYATPLKLKLEPNQKIELKAIVVNEAGRKSAPYGAIVWRRESLAPVAAEPNNKKAGVNFAFYKQEFASVADMEKASAEQKGETKSIQLGQFREKIADKMPFGLSFEGLINVAKDEIYEFELESLGGAEIWIDDKKVVGNDFQKERQVKTGIVPLKQGYHRLHLKYFKGKGESVLGLRWGIKGQGLNRIYGGELFH
jgi:hexosaminidase